MGDFSGADVEYENIVNVLLYRSVDEGQTRHLSKQTDDTLNY